MTDDPTNTPSSTEGLGAYLRVLAGYPMPQEALRSLIEGPLARLGAWAGFMWLERDGQLHAVAGHRTAGLFQEMYASISVNADMPVPLCFRESEVILTDVPAMSDEFAPLADHREAWEAFGGERATMRSLIHIPIVNRGVSLGVVGVGCTHPLALHTLEISVLDGIGSALGLWVTHPSTPLPDGLIGSRTNDEAPRALTLRQQHIVQLISQGRSNAAIAAQLSCSISTVKQEIQRIQRSIGATDRTQAAAKAIDLGLVPG